MDLNVLKHILVDTDTTNEIKEYLLIRALASEKDVIPLVMKILEVERKQKNELITDMNMELSRAHIYIDMHQESKKESIDDFNKSFVLDEIAKFYWKHKDSIQHCFNRFTSFITR